MKKHTTARKLLAVIFTAAVISCSYTWATCYVGSALACRTVASPSPSSTVNDPNFPGFTCSLISDSSQDQVVYGNITATESGGYSFSGIGSCNVAYQCRTYVLMYPYTILATCNEYTQSTCP